MWNHARVCKYGACDFCCGNTAAAIHGDRCSFLLLSVRLCPLGAAQTAAVRKPTEYCLSMRPGDPVRNRNNRPLLCLASAISQKACHIDWVYHALTGECSLFCPYLRTIGCTLFVFRDGHMTRRRDASDTGRKEGLGGGPSETEISGIGKTPHKKRLRQCSLRPDQGISWSLAPGIGVCRAEAAQRKQARRKDTLT